MALDISGIFFFMPVFSFLFVWLIVYAILSVTKVLGESKFVNVFVSLIMGVIFMSFSSLELYVRTILPWFVVLFVMVFLVLLVWGMAAGKLDGIRNSPIGWVFVAILVIVFLIAAIRVFNPVLHPDLVLVEGQEGVSLLDQLRDYGSGQVFGSIILLIVAGVVAWVITKTK